LLVGLILTFLAKIDRKYGGGFKKAFTKNRRRNLEGLQTTVPYRQMEDPILSNTLLSPFAFVPV
jgi:hypothetical protein